MADAAFSLPEQLRTGNIAVPPAKIGDSKSCLPTPTTLVNSALELYLIHLFDILDTNCPH